MTHPAYLASASTVVDSSWYVDNGASAHITNNLIVFYHATQLFGKEEIVVGNGETLAIKHTGVASIPCPNQKLKLNGLLHAPQVTKNLISVSKLACDNNILLEFGSSSCCVKDKRAGKVLLKGNKKQGLYELQNMKNTEYCASATVTQ